VLFLVGVVGILALSVCGSDHFASVRNPEGEWTTGFFILLGGILHWVRPRLRLPLATTGVLGGFYGAYFLIKSRQLVLWNILHDGIIAAGKWSETILIVLAIVCAVELAIMVKGTK
jgi:hypothetical protein